MDCAKHSRHGFCYREKFGLHDADIRPKKQPVHGCCLYDFLHTVSCSHVAGLLDWKEFGQAITRVVYELILQKGS